MSVADLRSLPNLPGFTFPEFKDRHHKGQTWNVVNNQRIEQKEGLSHDRPKLVKVVREPETWRTGSLPDSTTRQVFKHQAAQMSEYVEQPAWDAFDRHVLNFSGYFKEAVVETNLENYRVRKVNIYYYLEDDTMQINEPKQDNSGIPQGQLVRRHRFPAAEGGGYVQVVDLAIGNVLNVYGRAIMMTGCDDFTRRYYESIGYQQGPAEEAETDPFQQTREAVKVKSAVQPRTYEKAYREVMLGGGHINADMQQFLEDDKKVLRFFAIMDDVLTPQYERRPFTILFFLGDDKVEVREQYPLNCGRDNFPIFFRKAKMPVGVYNVDGPQSQPRKKSEFIQRHDFAVGMNITLLGNSHFFIYDADEFTRTYFREQMGTQLEPKIEVTLPERAVPRAQTPPYTGYGSWDDSMSSVTHLIPKPPRKDFVKLFQHSGKILRFKARFANPKPEDVDRIFVISYYLEDENLSIHEPPQRNLGIVTGRFLEKGVHMNQETGKLFEAGDLWPGQVVKVYNSTFEMLDMDEYTRKTFADPNAMHRKFDLEAVLQKLRESVRQQYPLFRDTFRRFDTNKDQVITIDEFTKLLQKFNFNLSREEVEQMMLHIDKSRAGQIGYNAWADYFLDPDYTGAMMAPKSTFVPQNDPSYSQKVAGKKMERLETERVREAARAISQVLIKNQNMESLMRKELGQLTHESTVSCEQLQEAFRNKGVTLDLEDIQRCVVFLMEDADLDHVDYVTFFKELKARFHDLAQRARGP